MLVFDGVYHTRECESSKSISREHPRSANCPLVVLAGQSVGKIPERVRDLNTSSCGTARAPSCFSCYAASGGSTCRDKRNRSIHR